MSFKERESAILAYLQKNKNATVGELCSALFVSEPTMRRDLTELNNKGKIIRTYGGASYKSVPGENLPQELREREQSDAKTVIGKKCLSLIKDGDTVMVDASSTGLALLRAIRENHSIVVITNNAKAPLILAETKVRTFVTGGELAANTYAYVGSYAEDFVRSFNADVFFFSVRRLTGDGRLTDNAIAENSVRRAMMARAGKSVLMLDSHKIGEACMNTLCDISEVDHIVCEKDISGIFPRHADKFI